MKLVYYYDKDGKEFSQNAKRVPFSEVVKLTGKSPRPLRIALEEGAIVPTLDGGVIWAEEA
jgi:hypothetical protein